MKDLSAKSSFTFKGLCLTSGDHIAFTTPRIPLSGDKMVEGCFTHIDDEGNFHAFSELLESFKDDGPFTEKDIIDIRVIHPGSVAVKMHAGNNALYHGQQVEFMKGGKKNQGELIGAFNSVICVWSDGKLINAGSGFFNPIQ